MKVASVPRTHRAFVILVLSEVANSNTTRAMTHTHKHTKTHSFVLRATQVHMCMTWEEIMTAVHGASPPALWGRRLGQTQSVSLRPCERFSMMREGRQGEYDKDRGGRE